MPKGQLNSNAALPHKLFQNTLLFIISMSPQRWSVGLFTLPQNFKTILDEASEKKALKEVKDKKGNMSEEGIKVICVGLSR